MKRILLRCSIASVALAVCIVAAGSGDARKAEFSSTNKFRIDGKGFLVGEIFSNDSTLLRRELEKLGMKPPEGFDVPEDRPALRPLFSGKHAVPSDTRPAGSPKLPGGLMAEHSLRLSGERHSVDLAFGTLESRGRTAAARLETEGWSPLSPAETDGRARMFRQLRGKESAVVFLDEKEGRFLLFRKLER
ncbi:MAG: hypothetical protein AB1346_06935 [Thermodesulfobacteriota bacterium]